MAKWFGNIRYTQYCTFSTFLSTTKAIALAFLTCECVIYLGTGGIICNSFLVKNNKCLNYLEYRGSSGCRVDRHVVLWVKGCVEKLMKQLNILPKMIDNILVVGIDVINKKESS